MSKIFVPELDTELLNIEYRGWVRTHGNGRSDRDLRFGQVLLNTYGYPNAIFPRLFYCESASDVYTMAYQEINS